MEALEGERTAEWGWAASSRPGQLGYLPKVQAWAPGDPGDFGRHGRNGGGVSRCGERNWVFPLVALKRGPDSGLAYVWQYDTPVRRDQAW